MANDERPYTSRPGAQENAEPGAWPAGDEAEALTPPEDDLQEQREVVEHGIISHFAALQAHRVFGAPRPPANDTTRRAPSESTAPMVDLRLPDLESMAVEDRFLSEQRAGHRPSLSDYILRYPEQREALLRLAMSQDPIGLVGGTEPQPVSPLDEAMAASGQELGVRRAMQAIARQGLPARRGAPQMKIAERRAGYAAGPDASAGERATKRAQKRARSADSGEAGPER